MMTIARNTYANLTRKVCFSTRVTLKAPNRTRVFLNMMLRFRYTKGAPGKASARSWHARPHLSSIIFFYSSARYYRALRSTVISVCTALFMAQTTAVDCMALTHAREPLRYFCSMPAIKMLLPRLTNTYLHPVTFFISSPLTSVTFCT